MSRAKRTRNRSQSNRPVVESAAQSSTPEATPRVARKTRKHWTRKHWIAFYVTVFVVVQSVVIFAFTRAPGDSRVRQDMLLEASNLREKGEYGAALEILIEYGRRWPGAYGTQNFEQRLGDYYYDAGQYAESGKHYLKSISADESVWDTRALAGRSLWLAENREKAVELFKDELESGNPQNDMANFYLGVAANDAGDMVAAWRYIQSIRDPAPYKDELKELSRNLEEKVLAPSREAAKEAAAKQMGLGTESENSASAS